MLLKRTSQLKDRIKNDVRIEEFMRLDGVELKARGANFKALCPFHADSDPSMTISTGKQMWHCFVCSDGGDVIDYAQKKHGMTFKEAMKYIATVVKIDITDFETKPEEFTPEEAARFHALDIFKRFADWCHGNLRQQDFDFFEKRGITKEVLDKFNVGYCPDTLTAKNAFPTDALMTVNVLKQNRWNDIGWTDVLVYPVFNEDGEIVYFHNRRYAGDEPRFAATDAANRLGSGMPYGVFQARKNANGRVVMVEGLNDVLACHSHGFNNTMGAMTAAIHDSHFKSLASLKIKRVYWIPDGDRPGLASLVKTPNVKDGVQVFVNCLDQNVDPDEYLLQKGRQAFQSIIDNSVLPIEYIISKLVRDYPHESMTDKVSILQALIQNIVELPGLEFKLACKHVADVLGVDSAFVEDFYKPSTAKSDQKVHDQDLERVVLSGMIADKEYLFKACAVLVKDDFFLNRHLSLFQILRGLADEVSNGVISSLNYEILNAEIGRLGMSKLFDNGQFLIGFIYSTKPENFDFALSTIKEYSRRRRLIVELDKHIKQVADQGKDLSEIVSSALSAISQITTDKASSVLSTEGIIPGWMDEFYGRIELKGQVPGVPFGDPYFRKLNHLMGGLRKQNLILLCGDSGSGKTNIALDMLLAMSDTHKTLFISTEMSENQLMDRMISKVSGISAEKIGLGMGLTEPELEKVRFTAVNLYDSKMRIVCGSSMTIGDVAAMIRHERIKNGVEAVFVDYAQRIIVPNAKPNDLYAKGVEVAGTLKNLVLEMSLPIVLLAQLDRSSHQDANPHGGQIAESYRYRQDCDSMVVVSRKSKKQIENGGGENVVGNSTIYLDKNRFGRQEILIDAMFDHINLRWREVLGR